MAPKSASGAMDERRIHERNFNAKKTASKLRAAAFSDATQSFFAELTTGKTPIYQVRLGVERFVDECCRSEAFSKYDSTPDGYSRSLKRMAERRLLSQSERRFIYTFYGLLSDSVNHPGRSFSEPRASRYVASYFISLVADKITRSRTPKERKNDLLFEERTFVERFMNRLRSGELLTEEFIRDFGIDLMNEIRQQCTPDDFSYLMQNIQSSAVADKLRSDCASLILNPWIHGNSFRNISELASELAGYFYRFFEQNSWRLNRCLALALENQASRGEAVVKLIESFADEDRDANFSNAAKYHNGNSLEAAQVLSARILDERTPLTANVWGAYYIFHNGDTNIKRRVRNNIRKRLDEVSNSQVENFLTSLVAP